jgi:hypothetical protein
MTRPEKIPEQVGRFLMVDAADARNRGGFPGVLTLSQGG